jgi:hypothetical protein
MIARSPLADMPTQMHGRVPPGGQQGAPPPGPGYGQNPYASNPYGQQGGQGGQGGYGGAPGYPGGAPPQNYGQPDPYGNQYGQQQHGGYGQPGQPGQPGQYGQQGGGYGQNDHDPRGQRPGGNPPDRRVDWLEE